MDEQLIAAAKEEMRLHSVKFTMDDIARKLHISKSTLYQKASSKAVLIAWCVWQIRRRFGRRRKR